MSDWVTTTIGDIAHVYDGPHATPRKTDAGPLFLSISSLTKGQLDLSESAHISEEDFARWTRRITPQKDDVLFSYETRLGEAALMPDGVKACLGRRMGLLRPIRERVEPRFLLYAYLAPTFQETIQQRMVRGATVDRIPLTELSSWPIDIPSLAQQKAISQLLAALDDKIAINDRIARTADQLAAVVTRLALQGAEAKPLSEIANITMGSSPPGETYNEKGEGLPFYQGARDFEFRYPSLRVWCTKPVRLGEEGDTLLSVRAPVGRLNVARELCCVGRGVAALRSRYGFPSVLFHVLSASPEVWAPYEAEGTVFGAINKKQLEELRFPAPDESVAVDLERQLNPFDRLVGFMADESETLRQLRNSLLPGLMSGEIRVREAEKVVEEAT